VRMMTGNEPRRRLVWCVILVALVLGCGISPAVGSQTAPTPVMEPDPEPAEPGVISLDRNFYVVIDGSGSMGSQDCAGQYASRVEAAKWAVKEFTSRSVPADVNLGLFIFDAAGASERVRLGKNNRSDITAQIDRTRAGGETPLNAAIRTAVTELSRQRAQQLGYGEYYAVVATDGEATDGNLGSGAVAYALSKGIPIITIGFCLKGDHPLSKGSLSYRNANSPQDLLSALRETQGESPYFDQAAFKRN
jgi:hypothetical protein